MVVAIRALLRGREATCISSKEKQLGLGRRHASVQDKRAGYKLHTGLGGILSACTAEMLWGRRRARRKDGSSMIAYRRKRKSATEFHKGLPNMQQLAWLW